MNNVPYSVPMIYLSDVVSMLFERQAEKKIAQFFRDYTGKEYVLITGSCRAALFLAYRAIGQEGKRVITSPLTCTSAISPIVEAGYDMDFTDTRWDTFLMDEKQIAEKLHDDTIAVQTTHLGGLMCDMKPVVKVAKENNLILIEDCAQGFGAQYEGQNCGSFGDVACFSFIKNIFGVGGGVLTTDDKVLYERAKELQNAFVKSSLGISIYRIFRSLLETYRKYNWVDILYMALISSRNKSSAGSHRSELEELKRMLKRPNMLEKKLAAWQLRTKVFPMLHKRIEVANELIAFLSQRFPGKLHFQKSKEGNRASFVKLYVFIENFNSQKNIKRLQEEFGVEARHLENKSSSSFQANISNVDMFRTFAGSIPDFEKYFALHKDILTLPIHEKMNEKDFENIAQALTKIIP